MWNATLADSKLRIHCILDLKVYYSMQLTHEQFFVEEIVGVEREIQQLFVELLTKMNYLRYYLWKVS